MPARFPISLANWFASHLIVFSLLAFFVVGLVLFGVIPVDGHSAGTASPVGFAETETVSAPVAATRTPTADSASSPDGDTQIGADQATAGSDADAPADPLYNRRKRPKLIGGTLPIYGGEADQSGTGTQPTTSGFRPSTGSDRRESQVPDVGQLVQRARRAFWNGNFQSAEAQYMDLIAARPRDPDIFGELGNLYDAMGEAALARDAFFEAGVRLKERGETEKLRQVIDLLSGQGDERARLLE